MCGSEGCEPPRTGRASRIVDSVVNDYELALATVHQMLKILIRVSCKVRTRSNRMSRRAQEDRTVAAFFGIAGVAFLLLLAAFAATGSFNLIR
jgi:hypothetical protein